MGLSTHTYFGQLGVFQDDIGGKAQCHICGDLFDSVSVHIRHSHDGMTAEDYRERFGLNRKRGLVGVDYSRRMSEEMKNRPEQLARFIASIPEFDRHRPQGPRRLETNLSPAVIESRAKGLKAAQAKVQELSKKGLLHHAPPSPEVRANLSEKMKQLHTRPGFTESITRKMVATRYPDVREDVSCVICGTIFSGLKKKKRMVCSIPCRNKLIGINNAKRKQARADDRPS